MGLQGSRIDIHLDLPLLSAIRERCLRAFHRRELRTDRVLTHIE